MARRHGLLAALLALAACGQQAGKAPGAPADLGANAPPVSIEAALDPCADKSGIAQAVCKDPALASTVAQIRSDLSRAAGAISTEGNKALVDGQRAWLETKGIDCNLASGTPEARECLKAALAERLAQAKAAVEEKGGFTFVRIENNAAQPVTAEAAAASGLAESAPPALTRELRYPRIDNVASEAAQKFNAIMAKKGQPKFRLEDATAESADYKITFASPDLVSVQFVTSEYNLGAAHPNNGVTSVTVLMKDGRELAQDDLFKPDSGWETFITRRAMRSLTKTFQEWGAGPPAVNDVRDTATKAHNWTIAEDGLVVLFPPYSVGPFALGPQEVKILWKDLQPYVNPNAPAPIKEPKAS
jgi:uncharacterized protein YecT (DUF1311 family)